MAKREIIFKDIKNCQEDYNNLSEFVANCLWFVKISLLEKLLIEKTKLQDSIKAMETKIIDRSKNSSGKTLPIIKQDALDILSMMSELDDLKKMHSDSEISRIKHELHLLDEHHKSLKKQQLVNQGEIIIIFK